MATGNENSNRSSDDIVAGTTPLLSRSNSSREENRPSLRTQSLRQAARLLRRASSRRMMREPSRLVRETATEQLEEMQSDWAYSKPVVVLDMVWNIAFVALAVAVLVWSRDEIPSVPLRLWILGYCLLCLLHMVCVMVEFKRRVRIREQVSLVEQGLNGGESAGESVGGENGSQFVSLPLPADDGNRFRRHNDGCLCAVCVLKRRRIEKEGKDLPQCVEAKVKKGDEEEESVCIYVLKRASYV